MKRLRYPVPVKRTCTVTIDKSTLPDGADPWPITVEADSVFEAASVIIQQFSVTWWANQMKVIEVRSGDEVWRVGGACPGVEPRAQGWDTMNRWKLPISNSR